MIENSHFSGFMVCADLSYGSDVSKKLYKCPGGAEIKISTQEILLTMEKPMSITQTYILANKAQNKLQKEAQKTDLNLRQLISHAHLLDNIIDHLSKSQSDSSAVKITEEYNSEEDISDSEEELDSYIDYYQDEKRTYVSTVTVNEEELSDSSNSDFSFDSDEDDEDEQENMVEVKYSFVQKPQELKLTRIGTSEDEAVNDSDCESEEKDIADMQYNYSYGLSSVPRSFTATNKSIDTLVLSKPQYLSVK